MLDCLIDERRLRARAVVGLFPAVSVGDDILVYDAGERGSKGAGEILHSSLNTDLLTTVHTLRQQMERPPGRPNLALADYIAPADSGLTDWLGFFAVTAGLGLDELVAEYEAAHDDYNAILAQALSLIHI